MKWPTTRKKEGEIYMEFWKGTLSELYGFHQYDYVRHGKRER